VLRIIKNAFVNNVSMTTHFLAGHEMLVPDPGLVTPFSVMQPGRRGLHTYRRNTQLRTTHVLTHQ
jgi:hypothetical protein